MGEKREIELFAWGLVTREVWDDYYWEYVTHTFEVTERWAESLIAAFKTFASNGSYPAILAEHDLHGAPVINGMQIPGLVFGRIIDVFITDKGISATVEWAGDMHTLMDDGFIDQFSPGIVFNYPHPHEHGVTLEVVLQEASFTSAKFLQNISNASSHYTMSQREDYFPTLRRGFVFSAHQPERPPMPDKPKPTTSGSVQLSDSQLDDIATRVVAKMSAKTTPSATTPASSGDDDRLAALERAQLDQAIVAHFSGNPVPEDLKTRLHAMKFSDAMSLIPVLPTVGPARQPAAEGGVVGQAAPPAATASATALEFSAIKEVMGQAKAEGVQPGPALLKFSRARGVDPIKATAGDWQRAMTETFGR